MRSLRSLTQPSSETRSFLNLFYALIFCAFSSSLVHADDHQQTLTHNYAVQLAWGQSRSRWELNGGVENMKPDSWRISVIKPQVLQFEVFSVPLQLDVDFSVYHWNDPWLQRHMSAVSAIPMFRYFRPVGEFEIFAGLGIGFAVLDREQWMDRQLGSRLQFEDKLELGLRYQQHQVAMNISHISNANLADVNHGVNVYQVSYTLYF